jgi:hypothetical protein
MHHHPTQSLPQAERRTLSTFFDSDALGPKPASVRKDGCAIFDNVFVKQDASLSIAQQPRQRSLSVQERAIAHVLAVMLGEVEGERIAARTASLLRSSSNRDKPSGPSTTASPSVVKLLALVRSAPSAIARSRAVQLFALRL